MPVTRSTTNREASGPSRPPYAPSHSQHSRPPSPRPTSPQVQIGIDRLLSSTSPNIAELSHDELRDILAQVAELEEKNRMLVEENSEMAAGHREMTLQLEELDGLEERLSRKLARKRRKIDEMAAHIDTLEAENAEHQQHIMELEAEAESAASSSSSSNSGNTEPAQILRPSGGRFVLQEAMGLAGPPESKKNLTYLAILRYVRSQIAACQLPWDSMPWGKVPLRDKADFYALCRSTMPQLKRYHQDWATAEIAKQFFKNKRSYEVERKTIPTPALSSRGRANGAKRSENGFRGKAVYRAARAEKAGRRRRNGEDIVSDAPDDAASTDDDSASDGGGSA